MLSLLSNVDSAFIYIHHQKAQEEGPIAILVVDRRNVHLTFVARETRCSPLAATVSVIEFPSSAFARS